MVCCESSAIYLRTPFYLLTSVAALPSGHLVVVFLPLYGVFSFQKGAVGVLQNQVFFQILAESLNIAHPQCMTDALMLLASFAVFQVPGEDGNFISGFGNYP